MNLLLFLSQTDISIGVQVAERLRSRIGQEQVPVMEDQTAGFTISLGNLQFDNTFKRLKDFYRESGRGII